MRHALAYNGGFERNFAGLTPGARTFQGTDGAEHPLPARPPDVDGVLIGYMEKPGKRFVAVRVSDDSADVVLRHELLLDPPQHLGVGKRFSADPTVIGDEPARALLADIIAANPEQRTELEAIRARIPHPRHRRGEG